MQRLLWEHPTTVLNLAALISKWPKKSGRTSCFWRMTGWTWWWRGWCKWWWGGLNTSTRRQICIILSVIFGQYKWYPMLMMVYDLRCYGTTLLLASTFIYMLLVATYKLLYIRGLPKYLLLLSWLCWPTEYSWCPEWPVHLIWLSGCP